MWSSQFTRLQLVQPNERQTDEERAEIFRDKNEYKIVNRSDTLNGVYKKIKGEPKRKAKERIGRRVN